MCFGIPSFSITNTRKTSYIFISTKFQCCRYSGSWVWEYKCGSILLQCAFVCALCNFFWWDIGHIIYIAFYSLTTHWRETNWSNISEQVNKWYSGLIRSWFLILHRLMKLLLILLPWGTMWFVAILYSLGSDRCKFYPGQDYISLQLTNSFPDFSWDTNKALNQRSSVITMCISD